MEDDGGGRSSWQDPASVPEPSWAIQAGALTSVWVPALQPLSLCLAELDQPFLPTPPGEAQSLDSGGKMAVGQSQSSVYSSTRGVSELLKCLKGRFYCLALLLHNTRLTGGTADGKTRKAPGPGLWTREVPGLMRSGAWQGFWVSPCGGCQVSS